MILPMSEHQHDPDGTTAAGVRVERAGTIGRIVLDNPSKRNATELAMYAAIPTAVAELTADPDLRVVILRGAGDQAFGAGSDISEFAVRRVGDGAASYNAVEEHATEALRSVPVPVVALIHGPCMGGGLGLALCADLRIAADDATFAVPPGKLGIGYPAEAARRLRDIVGPAVAKELLFTARVVDAAEAQRLGLVNRVVAKADLDAEVERLAEQIARLAPGTLRAAKLAVDAGEDDAEAVAAADAAVLACYHSEDYREGIAAFLEKRRPRFSGR